MIKKLSVIFFVLLMAGAMIVTTSGLQANAALGCMDLESCSGGASCSGPGSDENCIIYCSDGCKVTCSR